jgi:hypothetical protein
MIINIGIPKYFDGVLKTELAEFNTYFVVKPEYRYVGEFTEGWNYGYDSKWNIWIFDSEGNKYTPEEKGDIAQLRDVRVLYSGDNLIGLANLKGEIKVEPQYSVIYINDISEGLVTALKPTDFGNELVILNINGKEVANVGSRYESVGKFSEGKAVVKKEGLYGYIDMQGTEIIPLQFTYANEFSNGYASVRINENPSVIDENGSVIIEGKRLGQYCEGLFPVFIPGGFDREGMFVFTGSENSASIVFWRYGGLYGYMDENGEIIIEPNFDKADSFSDGIAMVVFIPESSVKQDKGYSYIDHNGMEVLFLREKHFEGFNANSGLIKVRQKNNGFYGFIKNPVT